MKSFRKDAQILERHKLPKPTQKETENLSRLRRRNKIGN